MLKSKLKKLFATLATIALVFTAVAPAALAAPTGDIGKLPDLNRTDGKIIIHKYATNAKSTTPGNGKELSDEDAAKLGTPMKGVGFTLYDLDYDEVLKDGFDVAKAQQIKTPHNDATMGVGVTDENGMWTYENLKTGYYLLVETDPPTDKDYIPMEPAIISVPYGVNPDDSREGWNYEVHVYPKNVLNEEIIKEEVKDPSKPKYNVGDIITYSITAKVNPELEKDTSGVKTYGKMKVWDLLDERLDYLTADPDGLVAVGIADNNVPIPLTKNVHFSETAVPETTADGEQTRVTWEFLNTDGKTQVEDLFKQGIRSVKFTFKVRVNEKALQGEPTIDNNATKEFTREPGDEYNEAKTPDVPVTVEVGGLTIKKFHKDRESGAITLLNGAEFKVAETEKDARDGKFIKVGYSDDPAANDLIVTTALNPAPNGEDGFAEFVGLKLKVDGTGKAIDTTFYLVETKAPPAPQGANYEYVLRPEPMEVTVFAATRTGHIDVENTRTGENGPGPIFKLPETGGMGTILFTIVGLALIGGSIAVLKKSKKDKEVKDNQ